MSDHDTTQNRYDLAIIGSGPAGMAAAAEAGRLGLHTALLDEQEEAGGQIYRAIGRAPLADEGVLGADYYQGRVLLEAMQAAAIDYLPGTTVWGVDEDLTLNVSRRGRSQQVHARRLLVATGAQERPVPFPGWTLPGVMTCGAAQVLLKSSAMVPPTPLVLAGSGPLLLLVASQLTHAGVPIDAVLDTTPRDNYRRAVRHSIGALRNPKLLFKGVGLLRALKRSGIPHITGVEELRAESEQGDQVSKVHYRRKGIEHQLDCRTLLVHQGVVPNVQLTRALELEHDWNAHQQCWAPRVDAWGETSRAGIFVAGDSSGIAGAQAAEEAGRLSVLQIARQLERLEEAERDKRSAPIFRRLSPQHVIRPFLDVLYQPARSFQVPEDDTIVCRCEEVTAGELRQIADAGCRGPNQAKAFCRAGMGPCQGRLCGLTVSQILADRSGLPIDAVGYYHIRPPIKPLTLGELADIAE
ncbi:NADPH-dependent 2,4-dienoyl-CoA reductase/sulfur reductase-like enzyme [Halomonas fontilapidosi]|uniref:NADPH-dependent 2,4-dienoyl-CoA reductase/sulfur reductase-like enzyme n=1 Tax=Halomonas fontilapidosi TaxID=616675 RepID=A0A7W5DLW4_9GAMM|nr:NAD(P)/FAD-dependent oxidoreductase [Halomonas fontilapidosi]MBB3185305.1 NADPH-dependent 2,4-dienoyl-CoA reductase/sulfur reductase-like enzyme [Halomonas fontilapidosi]